MNDFQVIQAALDRAARRRRLDRALTGLWRGIFVGAVVWLLALAVYKVAPVPPLVLTAGLGAVALCALAGFVIGGWRRPRPTETARWLDQRQGLQERLSTALEFADTPGGGEWKDLLVRDASERAKSIEPRRLLPFHLPVAARWAAVLLAVAVGLGFVPEHRSAALVKKQADAANIKEAGQQLVELTKRSLEKRAPSLEGAQQSLEKIEELGAHLDRATLSKAEALKELSTVRDQVSREADKAMQNPAAKPLDRAPREPGGATGKSPGALQKQIDAMQKALGKAHDADPGALDKLASQMQKAQQLAANLPDKDSAAGKAARADLAKALGEMVEEAKDLGLEMEDLDDAVKALEQGAIDQFVEGLKAAGTDLEKARDMAKQMKALRDQASQMGKDLAEQLKNGQAEAAAETLKQMMDKLKSGELRQKDVEEMASELKKALDPAGEYGKVAEHLQEALKQLGQCNKPGASEGEKAGGRTGAAESLAQAADELQKLMQQMGDAQQLADALEAIERAQEAIASGKGWGQCDKPGRGKRGGAGQSGKGFGAGVGTWADDNGWTYFEDVPQQPVDNSGVIQPDQEGRGLTDRGEGEVSDTLNPAKVKGRLNPDAPIPHITLKGVGIKGRSTVNFQEAAPAAQEEAQNALNQDQVPRAYRGPVKDYFNDLKK